MLMFPANPCSWLPSLGCTVPQWHSLNVVWWCGTAVYFAASGKRESLLPPLPWVLIGAEPW